MRSLFPKLLLPLCGLAVALTLLVACQKAKIDTNEAVRDAVVSHIAARGDLGLGELDIQVIRAEFAGDSCNAEVRFLPKGQPVEAGMTMKYTLEREGDAWKVKPNPAASGHAMQGQSAPEGVSPQGGQPGGAGEMPPGHPPVAPQPR